MEQERGGEKSGSSTGRRVAGSFGASLIVFLFVWIVFDNLALAILFALMAGGGAAVAQNAAEKKPD